MEQIAFATPLLYRTSKVGAYERWDGRTFVGVLVDGAMCTTGCVFKLDAAHVRRVKDVLNRIDDDDEDADLSLTVNVVSVAVWATRPANKIITTAGCGWRPSDRLATMACVQPVCDGDCVQVPLAAVTAGAKSVGKGHVRPFWGSGETGRDMKVNANMLLHEIPLEFAYRLLKECQVTDKEVCSA